MISKLNSLIKNILYIIGILTTRRQSNFDLRVHTKIGELRTSRF